jgi:hypothetical protein
VKEVLDLDAPIVPGESLVAMTYGEVRLLAPPIEWSAMVVADQIEGVPGVALHFVSKEGLPHDGIPGEEKDDDVLEQMSVFSDPMGGGVSL